jgi:hypothetical protein
MLHSVCQMMDGVKPMQRMEAGNGERATRGRSSRSRPQSMDSTAYEKLLAGTKYVISLK